jgi:hypothetical protein
MREQINKLEAARRQLAIAIRLFFDKSDPIAIHTLAAAAYQIFYDLSKEKEFISLVKGNSMIRETKRREWELILNNRH